MALVYETVGRLAEELPDNVALIGFAGAPWTVATYMVEGRGSRDHAIIKQWAYGDPDGFGQLIDLLVTATVEYLGKQVDAGAEAVQLFDTWAGILDENTYRRAALPAAQKIFAALKDTVPRMYLIKDGSHLMQAMSEAGADALSLDWRTPLDQGRAFLGDHVPVQGNMDPGALLGTADSVRANVQDILDRNAGRPGHVFNLGHGLLPQTPVENLQVLKETVYSHASVVA